MRTTHPRFLLHLGVPEPHILWFYHVWEFQNLTSSNFISGCSLHICCGFISAYENNSPTLSITFGRPTLLHLGVPEPHILWFYHVWERTSHPPIFAHWSLQTSHPLVIFLRLNTHPPFLLLSIGRPSRQPKCCFTWQCHHLFLLDVGVFLPFDDNLHRRLIVLLFMGS